MFMSQSLCPSASKSLALTLGAVAIGSPRMRDIETIDAEFRLLLAIRHMAREAEGRTPNTARIDALLDERSECQS